jgi:carboxylesterase type B
LLLYYHLSVVFITLFIQILESGSSNGLATFTAAQQETSWEKFVAKIPSCASVATSGHTFSCLRNATIEEITTAMVQGVELGDLYSAPTLDTGRNSLYPDLPSRIYSKGRFAKLPFIAGTNLDEGTGFASQQPLTEKDLKAMLVAINASPGSSSMALEATTDKVLELYQEDPAVGSPYRTGDELFGLPASYKRHASIRKCLHATKAPQFNS